MWGTKASDWNKVARRAGTMKWHLVDEDSLEEREIEVGWGIYKEKVPRTFGVFMCGGNKHKWIERYIWAGKETIIDHRIPLVLKETIKLFQANVCTYCKNYRMKELGISDKVIG